MGGGIEITVIFSFVAEFGQAFQIGAGGFLRFGQQAGSALLEGDDSCL